MGHLGLGTPVGFGGIGLEYDPVRWFGVEGGAGLNGRGPQFAVMARTRMIFSLVNEGGLDLGAGFSGGPYRWRELTFGDGRPAVKDWDFALWANGELGVSNRTASGFVFRFYVGYAFVLNRGAGYCTDTDSGDIEHCRSYHHGKGGEQLPYFGLAMGYAFR